MIYIKYFRMYVSLLRCREGFVTSIILMVAALMLKGMISDIPVLGEVIAVRFRFAAFLSLIYSGFYFFKNKRL